MATADDVVVDAHSQAPIVHPLASKATVPTLEQAVTSTHLSTPSNPLSLETLPTEILRQVLCDIPSLGALKSLVHASPQLHQVYTRNRLHILKNVLQQCLGDVLVDAHAAYLSGLDSFLKVRSETTMFWDFLDKYEARRTTSTAALAEQLTIEEIVQMAHFHASVIEPLKEHYSRWSLAALRSLHVARGSTP